ncbi:MAG: YceD family protein [bacterium]
MVEVVRTVPAPEGLGVALARVPPGTDVELDLRLESVVEGVLVTGTAAYEVAGDCARCLDPVSYDEEAEFTELFAYPATDARGREIDEGEADEEAPSRIEGDIIDLEPVVRDAVVLRLPIAPLCREDCPGLCATCGERLDDPGHVHEEIDPRWEALARLAQESRPPGRQGATQEATQDDKEEGS